MDTAYGVGVGVGVGSFPPAYAFITTAAAVYFSLPILTSDTLRMLQLFSRLLEHTCGSSKGVQF